jgi:hypothetical protein
MSMLAEVIASAFASGSSWGGKTAGKQLYCASPRPQRFLEDNPNMAEKGLWRCTGAAAALTPRFEGSTRKVIAKNVLLRAISARSSGLVP